MGSIHVQGIAASGDAIILISDDSSISVEYLDLDSTGGETTFTAEADTPTHSGSVSLDSDGYKVADTVTVTVEDADLNVDSGRADIYTAYEDRSAAKMPSWNYFPYRLTAIHGRQDVHEDINNEMGCRMWTWSGLDQQFSLRETGSDSGEFTRHLCHSGRIL